MLSGSGGLLRIKWYAVRIEAGDFVGVEPGRMLVEGLEEARDHRMVALVAFQGLPDATHVFTVAVGAEIPAPVCWRRGALAASLGELDPSTEGLLEQAARLGGGL